MQNEPTWVTLNENLEGNSLYTQILNLVENKEEWKEILNLSVCKGPGKCTGSCSGLQ